MIEVSDEDRALLHKAGITTYVSNVFRCESCEELMEEDETETLYECSRCGGLGVGVDNRRCEDDNIFMAKQEEPGCGKCSEGRCEPAEQIVYDPETHELATLEEVLELLRTGETRAARDERLEAEAEARQQAAAEALAQRWTLTTLGDVKVGDYLVTPDRNGRMRISWSAIVGVRYDPGGDPVQRWVKGVLQPGAVSRESYVFYSSSVGHSFNKNEDCVGDLADQPIHVFRGTEEEAHDLYLAQI